MDERDLLRNHATTLDEKQAEWDKLWPKFNLNDQSVTGSKFWENDELCFVRMEALLDDRQIKELPVYWEKITGTPFPKKFAFCLFDTSKTCHPFTGQI